MSKSYRTAHFGRAGCTTDLFSGRQIEFKEAGSPRGLTDGPLRFRLFRLTYPKSQRFEEH